MTYRLTDRQELLTPSIIWWEFVIGVTALSGVQRTGGPSAEISSVLAERLWGDFIALAPPPPAPFPLHSPSSRKPVHSRQMLQLSHLWRNCACHEVPKLRSRQSGSPSRGCAPPVAANFFQKAKHLRAPDQGASATWLFFLTTLLRAALMCGLPKHLGRVAQLVEQGIENPRVGGSIPSPATM